MNQDEVETRLRNIESRQIGISNSEVQAGITCEQAWLFGYHPEAKLSRGDLGPSLTRGIAGHKALEFFYGSIRNEDPYKDAVDATMAMIETMGQDAYLSNDFTMMDVWEFLRRVMPMYFKHYENDIKDWEILELESFHHLEWPGEQSIYLPMRLDMVIYQRGGKFKGETSPVDHKFTNQFWKQHKFDLNAQLPLYIRALRNTRYEDRPPLVVKRSIVNQIRTGAAKDATPWEIFKREFIEYNDTVAENVLGNHYRKAKRLAELKRMPYAQADAEVQAAWGNPACDYCHFKSLCVARINGRPLASLVATEYVRNDSYGYPDLEELTNERKPI